MGEILPAVFFIERMVLILENIAGFVGENLHNGSSNVLLFKDPTENCDHRKIHL